MTLPLDRFCNLVWHWASRNADAEQRAKLLDSLEPPRLVLVSPSDDTPVAHHPGLAPPNIPRPDWYKGDHQAFQSSVKAAQDAGLVGAV